ncbi:hypothetical protein EZS27_006610 [termite gut metagenome]|uniref:FrrB n=1 Tax=termite gut metagenome TaxID=433724 RepID=A0A5J4SKV9_9ZZZZ
MKQIKGKPLRAVVALLQLIFVSIPAIAQDKTEVSIGADVVSGYIWRGTELGGVSVQPGITLSRSGFSLTAWSSVGLERIDTKEFDLTLGYSIGKFSAAVTDYWFNTSNSYFDYAAHTTAHIYEATLGYDFGIFSLSWNTNLGGFDYAKKGDKRAYSTYAEVAVPFTLGGYDFAAEVGLTPWEGAYSNKLNVTNIGLKAAKNIVVTESFSIPTFAKVVINPYEEQAYFVFGLSF